MLVCISLSLSLSDGAVTRHTSYRIPIGFTTVHDGSLQFSPVHLTSAQLNSLQWRSQLVQEPSANLKVKSCTFSACYSHRSITSGDVLTFTDRRRAAFTILVACRGRGGSCLPRVFQQVSSRLQQRGSLTAAAAAAVGFSVRTTFPHPAEPAFRLSSVL